MKTGLSLAKITGPMLIAWFSRTACATRLLPLLLLCTLAGTITITGNPCPVGALTIPNGVTRIGDRAFFSCSSLTSVTIPNDVTSIGGGAFSGCTSLNAITVEALNASYSSVDGVLFNKSQTTLIQFPGGKAGSYSIPNSVTTIWGSAFYGCTRLTSVTIPDSVTSIGDDAFLYCFSLTSVTIPNSVTSIGFGAFQDCTRLTSVTIPDSVTSIGDSAFADCTRLSSVTIPNSVTSIGDGAFSGCTRLTSVTIPNSVTSFGVSAFFRCTSLTSVTIGNSVTRIEAEAFYGCTSLISVTIPNSVTRIWDEAFGGCTSLTRVYFQGNAPSLDSSVFDDSSDTIVYYLPGTTGWGASFGDRPTAVWYPEVQIRDASFGVRTNQFGFNITWASGRVVVVEACTDLANPVWTPVGTNTLTGGSSYFSDPEWTNYPARFYRLRSP